VAVCTVTLSMQLRPVVSQPLAFNISLYGAHGELELATV
jgi:hypothetical protein